MALLNIELMFEFVSNCYSKLYSHISSCNLQLNLIVSSISPTVVVAVLTSLSIFYNFGESFLSCFG